MKEIPGTNGTSENVVPLRGHHLQYINLLTNGMQPKELVDGVASELVWKRKSDPLYAHDVAGDTPQEETAYLTGLEDAFTELANLPDETPLTIVNGQKDLLCKTCIHGNHCADNGSLRDDLYIAAFAQLAVATGLEDRIKSDQDVSPSVTTTAGVARAVLQGSPLDSALSLVRSEEKKKRRVSMLKKYLGYLR